MSDFYQIFTVDGLQKDEAAILQVLRDIKSGKLVNDVKVLNYFKEMPVSFSATVDYIDSARVELTVHQTQVIAMQAQKMAFLKSRHLPHDAVASVNTLRAATRKAVLFKFAYAQIRSERRECLRVEVDGGFDVAFRGGGVSVRGELQDISLTGLSFVAPENCTITEEVAGEVTIDLAGVLLQVPALLLRVLTANSTRKYILKLQLANYRQENFISQFIAQQQNIIIKEMKERI